ncbi:MAG: hypothetical protein Q9217_001976 [Psora testacea]
MPPNQHPYPSSPRGRSPQRPSSPTEQPSTSPQDGRGIPPQRPPRPDYVPPLLQNSPGGLQPRQYYWEEGQDSFSGDSWSSRPSTIATGSSTSSIPDFPPTPHMPPMHPMPAPPIHPPPPRRNLGPPPSARRGVSSYYSQNPFVPSIPEERSESHNLYASSHVMTGNWGDDPPEYRMGGGIYEEDEDDMNGGLRSEGSSGRQSKASDYSEQSNLVRGPPKSKPLQPFMETIESGDESDRSKGSRGIRELDWQARQDERFRPGFASGGEGGEGPGRDVIGRHNFKARENLQYPYSGYQSDATFLDSPRSASPAVPQAFKPIPASNPYSGTPNPAGSPVDPRVGQILGNLEKGGALASSGTVSPGESSTPSTINQKYLKSPPPLNLEASKATSARGSASSLPELIRRATRLASNLDRGKTASRMCMLDVLNKKDMEKREEAEQASRNSSISDILAAFPSLTLSTSTGRSKPAPWSVTSPRGRSNLSRAQTITYGSTRSTRTQGGRRICGMPVWALVLLLIILLLFIAAAVVIPITLIVIPRQNSQSPTIDSCQKSNPCANGGSSLLLNNGCRCICAGGFTGSTCNVAPDTGCTTSSIPGESTKTSYPNATLGSSIPRILTAASANYSIPLSGYTIAALFSYTNLSCTSENALITFNERSQRRRSLADVLLAQIEEQPLLSPPSPAPVPLAQVLSPSPSRPTPSSHVLNARASAVSSNGIVFAAGSGPTAAAGNAILTDVSAPPAASSTPNSNSISETITPTILDFARTAVLFIFQETSNLSVATTAMNRLQALLSGGKTFDASQTSAGGNITVDLSALTVGFGNGTVYGGEGS